MSHARVYSLIGHTHTHICKTQLKSFVASFSTSAAVLKRDRNPSTKAKQKAGKLPLENGQYVATKILHFNKKLKRSSLKEKMSSMPPLYSTIAKGRSRYISPSAGPKSKPPPDTPQQGARFSKSEDIPKPPGSGSQIPESHKRRDVLNTSSASPLPPTGDHPQLAEAGLGTGIRHQHTHDQKSSGAYTASEYVRPATQTPNTSVEHEQHYIISLCIDAKLHKTMTALREEHFPKHLNRLAAHIALFHALPGSQLDRIKADLTKLCAATSVFRISADTQPRRQTKGVAVGMVEGKDQVRLVFQKLKSEWNEFLSEQDRAFYPHWTVMNKVDNQEKVDECATAVKGTLKRQLRGKAEGLELFLYKGGYWHFKECFMFQGHTEIEVSRAPEER